MTARDPHESADDALRRRLLRRTVELAAENVTSGRGGPFGALVARGGEVLAEAVNGVTAGNDPTAHAEIEAIRGACRRLGTFELRGCELYASCEPCPMCLGAAYWARLDRIWFAAGRDDAARAGFSDADIYREIALPPTDRTVPARALPLDDALAPFTAWAAEPDKVRY